VSTTPRDRRQTVGTCSIVGLVELDHLFCLVRPGFPEEAELRDAGCTVGFGREHAGQGTENRLLLLRNAYLEFIWIRDLAEAANNPLRLDRRWAPGGAVGCPFGIGLRGKLPAILRKDFAEHRLEGFSGRLLVHKASNEDGMLPLLFVLEGDAPTPADQGFPPALFEHANGALEIERVTIMGPAVEDLRVPRTTVPVDLWPDTRWRMEVEVASKVHREVDLLPQMSLQLRRRGPGIVGPND
jgi:hypothetical protein